MNHHLPPCWRRRSHAFITSVPLALLVAACEGDAASPAAPAMTESAATRVAGESRGDDPTLPHADSPARALATGELDIIVPAGPDGKLPADLWVTCNIGSSFQVSDLDEIVSLEAGDPGGIAEAIEPFLSSEEGVYWPQEGWQILRQTEQAVLLVHADADSVAFMDVERIGGQWRYSGSQLGAECPLHYITPEGLHRVDWRLDPASPPDAGDTTLAVLVTERQCVSGGVLGDRLLGPQVVMTDDVVRIAFAAQPPPGDSFTCPSNPEAKVSVELSAPLGERQIIEGLAIGIDLEDFLN